MKTGESLGEKCVVVNGETVINGPLFIPAVKEVRVRDSYLVHE